MQRHIYIRFENEKATIVNNILYYGMTTCFNYTKKWGTADMWTEMVLLMHGIVHHWKRLNSVEIWGMQTIAMVNSASKKNIGD